MKRVLSFLISIFAIGFLLPTSVFAAQKYTSGELIKSPTDHSVYFIGPDNRRYLVPDQQTYHTWYTNFQAVKTLESPYDIYFYQLAQEPVTVRPGTTLVKFEGSPRVYAVDRGAVLRFIRNEKIANKFYGLKWSERLVTLPHLRLVAYTFGTPIDNEPSFSRKRAIESTASINDELRARKVVQEYLVNTAQEPKYRAVLTSIEEDLYGYLDPWFNPTITSYRLAAVENENRIRLRLVAEHPQAKIMVNGSTVNSGDYTSFALHDGENRFTIVVVTPNGESTTYTLVVHKKPVSHNAFLSSLTENMKADFSPAFDPEVLEYELRADYLESSLRLIPQIEDSSAKVSINGSQAYSFWYQETPLQPGPNVVNVRVIAQSGNEKVYTVKVYRANWPNTGDLDLIGIQENLAGTISPSFDPNYTLYYLPARADESRVTLYVTPRRNEARVFINGDQTTSKLVHISSGRNEVEIVVKLGEQFTNKYTLVVDREVR